MVVVFVKRPYHIRYFSIHFIYFNLKFVYFNLKFSFFYFKFICFNLFEFDVHIFFKYEGEKVYTKCSQ